MWLKDPKTGRKSVTLTLLVATFVVAIIKLMFSSMGIASIEFETFSGTDFAATLGAMGAIYGFRKYSEKDKKD